MSQTKAYEANTQQYGQNQQAYGNAYPPNAYGQPQANYGYSQPQANYGQPGQMGYAQTTQSAVVVTQPGAPNVVYTNQQSDLTVPAVLVCLFCFWPTGICAIVQARNARQAMYSGDMALAEDRHRSARNLIIASIICGIIVIAVSVVLRVVLFSTTGYY